MMVTVQFVIRLFLSALLPLGVALPALALGTGSVVADGSPNRLPANAAQHNGAQTLPKADATVRLRDGRFNPAEVTAKQGGLIRFINSDDRDYSLTTREEDLASFSSGIIKPRKHWDFRIPAGTPVGTYRYNCKLRPRAKGTLRIVAE